METADATMEDTQSPDIFLHTCKDYLENIVTEYFTLSILNSLTEQQANRTANILSKAEADPLLSFLIDEADHAVGHLLNLLDVDETRAEQEVLRRKIDKNWITWSISKSRVNNGALVPQYTLKQAQARLRAQGLYRAEIDGVCGDKTIEAFQQLERQFLQHIEKKGLCPQMGKGSQRIETNEAIRFIKESGMDGKIRDDADLLSFGTWLSFC